jgi:hypothetical protein
MVAGVHARRATRTVAGGPVGHGNSDHSERDARANAREEEEQPELEPRERETARTDALGNSRRGGSTGSGASGGSSLGHRGPRHGGDPVDDGAAADPARPAPTPEWTGPAMFGDEDWLPDTPSVTAPLSLDAWLPDARADDHTFDARWEALGVDSAPANGAPGARLAPDADLLYDHLGAWLRVIPSLLASGPTGSLLAWLAETGGAHLDPVERPRSRRRIRQAALGTLALLAARPPTGASLDRWVCRHGLAARSGLLDREEHAAAARGPALHRTVEVLAGHLTATPSEPPSTAIGPAELRAWWARRLALRPAAHWRPPEAAPADPEVLAAFLAPPPEAFDRQEGEAIARQGIGLFREVLRSRIRGGAALAALALSAPLALHDELGGCAARVAARHDDRTTQVLAHLRRLGRGLSREGWSAALARTTLLQAMSAYDQSASALLDDLGTLHGMIDEQAPPEPSPGPVDPLHAALRRGDLHRARALLPAPRTAEDVLCRTLIDTLVPDSGPHWRPLADLQPKLLQAGRPELALLIDTVLGPAAWRDGDLDEAERFAQRLYRGALTHVLPASCCDATCLLIDLRAARGADPEAVELLLLAHARDLHALGAPVWAGELLWWAPPA